jgi:hypothetical protein
MSRKAPRTFEVGDRIVFDNFGFYSYGVVSAKHNDEYEVRWDDGFVDELNADGTPYTYDAWELLNPTDVVDVI